MHSDKTKTNKKFVNTLHLRAMQVPVRYAVCGQNDLATTFKTASKTSEASEHEELARAFAENDSEYNNACFEALCGNYEKALSLLEIALGKGQLSKEWACQDPDLENLRDNQRFKALVGG